MWENPSKSGVKYSDQPPDFSPMLHHCVNVNYGKCWPDFHLLWYIPDVSFLFKKNLAFQMMDCKISLKMAHSTRI